MPHDLNTASIGDGIFLLYSAAAGGALQIDLDLVLQYLAPSQAQRALDVLAENDSAGEQSQALRFPPWESALGPGDIRRLSALRGATLLCLERDASVRLDYPEYLKLSALGASRVVFRNMFADEAIREIEFRPAGRLARARNIARLLPHAVCALSDQPWLTRLGAKKIGTLSQGWQNRIEAISAAPDTELALSYALFEGARQMPPIHVPHAHIATKGNGRYSIWNQAVFLSPTEEKRRNKRPYWLVPVGAKTEPFLEMVPRAVSVTHWDTDVSLQAMKRVLSRPEIEPFALQPGNPVVVCTHGLSPGGAERQWIVLAEALSAAGYAVTFVVCNPLDGETAHYLPDLQKSGIPLVEASTISPAERMRSCIRDSEAMVALRSKLIPERDRLMNLAATFAALAPKAVFTQLDEPNLLAGFAAHIAGVPRVILSFCNVNPTNFDYIYKDWYRTAYRLLSTSSRVRFSGNQRDANIDYANWIGMEADRVAHIPNGISRETFPIPTERQLAAARDELNLAADTPVLLGVFRLSAEKDPLAFVEVCARVARHVPALRAFLVGVGPMQQQVEERIARLGIGAHLSLLGRRSDINVLMTLASVFLLTSSKEGMPNVLMEAQLMGTAVVSTRLPGTVDAVKDGETASLRPVGDIEALAAACVDVLGAPARARRMGDAALAHAESTFSTVPLLARRYLDLAQRPETPSPLL